MSLLKLLLLASGFLAAFLDLANLANAEPLTVEEMRSQISHRSADLLPSNSDSSHPSNKQLTAHGDNAHGDDDADETEIKVTGKRSPFAPSSAPTYIIPKSEIERQNPSTAAELLRSHDYPNSYFVETYEPRTRRHNGSCSRYHKNS